MAWKIFYQPSTGRITRLISKPGVSASQFDHARFGEVEGEASLTTDHPPPENLSDHVVYDGSLVPRESTADEKRMNILEAKISNRRVSHSELQEYLKLRFRL